MKKLFCLLSQTGGFIILFFVFLNPKFVSQTMITLKMNDNSYHSFLVMIAFALIFLGICGFLCEDKPKNKNYEKFQRKYMIKN